MLSKPPFDATYFQKNKKCSDESNRQSIFFWFTKSTPGSAGGQKEAYGEGKSRQEKVSELE